MPKRTLLLIIVLVLVTAGLLYLATTPKNSVLPLTPPGPTPTPAAQTILSMNPSPVSVASSSGSINIMIDTGDNKITAAQLELSYDPKVLTNVNITTPVNSVIPDSITLLKSIDRVKGTVSYAIAIKPTANGVKGSGTLATVTFQTLTTVGQTSLSFRPETQVTAEGITNLNVVKQQMGATILLSPNQTTTTAPLQTQITITPQ